MLHPIIFQQREKEGHVRGDSILTNNYRVYYYIDC